jgi:hypothetical protein
MSSLLLTIWLLLLQDIRSSDTADQGDEDVWETVGATTERDTSPPSEEAQQQTSTVEPQASVEEVLDPPPATAVAVEQPKEIHVDARAASEAGIVDIASILGAPTVTVVRSTL